MPYSSTRHPLRRHPDRETVLRLLPFGICAVDADFTITYLNPQFSKSLCIQPHTESGTLTLEGLLGGTTSDEDRAGAVAGGFSELALRAKMTRATSEARISSVDGSTFLVRCEAIPDGGYLFVLQPAEKPLAASDVTGSEGLNDVLLNLPLGLSMYGADEKLIVCNTQYIGAYALDPAMVKPGAAYADVLAHSIARGNQSGMSTHDYYAKRMQENRNAQMPTSHSKLWNGRIMQITNRPLPDGGWVSLHEDVTEKLEAAKRIAYLANHDALTGLPNRNMFHAKMSEILAKIHNENGWAAVLFMDLDHFKQVNDKMGHLVGDRLLVGVAERLRRFVRADDLIVRLGGDEFVIVQNNASHPIADVLAKRLIAAMSEPFLIDGTRVEVGLSVGIALAPSGGNTSDVLLKHADLALYRSKSRGGGNHCFFEEDELPEYATCR